jgi:hypothetical protein
LFNGLLFRFGLSQMMYARDPIVDDERALAAKFDHSELIE